MKKEYQKPEYKYLSFSLEEDIAYEGVPDTSIGDEIVDWDQDLM